MISFLWTILLVACASARDQPTIEPLKEKQTQFCCITYNEQGKPDVDTTEPVDGPMSLISQDKFHDVIAKLKNGRNLTMLIEDTNKHDYPKIKHILQERAEKSRNNVCFATYKTEEQPPPGSYEVLGKHWVEKQIGLAFIHYKFIGIVAKEVNDFIVKVRDDCKPEDKKCLKHLSQVTIVGFGLSAYIGAETSRLLTKGTHNKEKVAKFIAVNPRKIDKPDFRGVAEYTQTIHTSKLISMIDTIPFLSGDVNILVKFEPSIEYDAQKTCESSYIFDLYLNSMIVSETVIVVANEEGEGRLVWENRETFDETKLNDGECIVGVYGTNKSCKKDKQYKVTIHKSELEKMNDFKQLSKNDNSKLLLSKNNDLKKSLKIHLIQ